MHRHFKKALHDVHNDKSGIQHMSPEIKVSRRSKKEVKSGILKRVTLKKKNNAYITSSKRRSHFGEDSLRRSSGDYRKNSKDLEHKQKISKISQEISQKQSQNDEKVVVLIRNLPDSLSDKDTLEETIYDLSPRYVPSGIRVPYRANNRLIGAPQN